MKPWKRSEFPSSICHFADREQREIQTFTDRRGRKKQSQTKTGGSACPWKRVAKRTKTRHWQEKLNDRKRNPKGILTRTSHPIELLLPRLHGIYVASSLTGTVL